MPNGWLPQDGSELVPWINQQLRILNRHRHIQYVGDIPGAIDASGGEDTFPPISYIEGIDDNQPLPTAPLPGSSPPAESETGAPDLSDVPIVTVGTTVQGVTRARALTFTSTGVTGGTLLTGASWDLEDLYYTDGADVAPDPTDPALLAVGEGGWFEVYASASTSWGSTQSEVYLQVEWQDMVAGVKPTEQEGSPPMPALLSLPSPKIWLPNAGWLKVSVFWDSGAAAVSPELTVDVTRIG